MMKKYLFLILIIPLIILIILALPGNKSFRFSGENILEQIGRKTHIISVHKFKQMKAGESGIHLVDLRDGNDFAQGHLPGALNLPAENLSTGDIHRFFEGTETARVLYAGETYISERYWILFTQMGIGNLYVLETGPELDSLIMQWDNDSSRRILVDEDPAFTFQPDTAFTF
ncbi:MAG: rhodanese-like domain-containing protein [Bacteroidales bacterium]|nr:rhodanese-like domain-containing protein [Bacteroidales bacterium]